MNCLFINTNYRVGGAALAASRLADGLNRLSIDIRWYVKNSNVSNSDIYIFERKITDRIIAFPYKGRVTYSPYILSTKYIANKPRLKDIDLLHFHNLHGDYFNYKAISRLTENKPAIWTLHDMWSFTGHCAYSKACERWKTGCGNCPDLNEYPAVRTDHTRSEWFAKSRAVRRSNLHIVTPSVWLGKLAQESFLNLHPISVIPYGLDTECFSPKPKNEVRRKLGISESQFTVLLCSADLSDPRKPQRVLCEAINQVSAQKGFPIQVITFGNGSIREHLDSNIVLHEFGYIDSEEKKADLFSAADVFLFASKADNLPLVIQESLSCGTSVIANDVGGIPDMVIDGETGWLLGDMNVTSYSEAIFQAYSNKSHRERLSIGARRHAVDHYSLLENAEKYKAIYENLLKNKK